MKVAAIYKITNLINGNCYVGQSLDAARRLVVHRSQLNRGCHHNPHLQHAWKQYGAAAFSFEIVASVVPGMEDAIHELNRLETVFIEHFGAMEHGYNLNTGGDSRRPSLATREKLSASHKGQKQPPMSAATKEKLRIANTGRVRSAEARRRMSAGMKGRKPWNKGRPGYTTKPAAESRKLRIGLAQQGEKNHNFGKTTPEATKQKLREALQGSQCHLAKLDEADVALIKKRLIAGERGADLAREYGVAKTQISCIKHGKTWRHVLALH